MRATKVTKSSDSGTISVPRSIQPQEDLLAILRRNLRRIEESKEGHTRPAVELKNLLLRRIAVIEAATARISAFTPVESQGT